MEYDNSKLRVSGSNTYDSCIEYLKEVKTNIVATDDLLNSVIYITAGINDNKTNETNNSIYENYEGLSEWAIANMAEGHSYTDLFLESHDLYTWAQSFYRFANEICWSNSSKTNETDSSDKVDNSDKTEVPNKSEESSDSNVTTETSKISATATTQNQAVQTGDNAPIAVYGVTAFIAACCIVGFIIKKKKLFSR